MVQELQLQIMAAQEVKDNLEQTSQSTNLKPKKPYKRWFRVILYILFLLSGQSIALLLGRLYFDKGGKSEWIGTLVQLVGFPILIPYYLISTPKHPPSNPDIHSKQPATLTLVLIYLSFGLFIALDCFLYSVGIKFLPVSTFSLLSSSQLAFNALFSLLLNKQKFTPYIINSLVLLSISSTLLVFQTDSKGSKRASKGKYILGFVCTVAASAGYGLVLSLTQLAFRKVLKNTSFKVVMDMIVYQSIAATGITLVGLFASGEWKGLRTEMNEFELGKVSYIMTLVWTAVFWQVFAIGCVGLIFDISSLFSNAISVVGLPIVPVLAVVFFHDKMTGVKAMAMVLGVWGFVSYAYEHYVDEFKRPKPEIRRNDIEVHEVVESAKINE